MPLARFAAALLLAAGIIGLPTLMTPDRRGPGVAFADVIARVRAAKTVTYTMTIGDKPEKFLVSMKEPGLSRTVLPGGSISINDAVAGKSIMLDPARKSVLLINQNGPGPDADLGGSQIEHLRTFRGKPDAELGEKVVDGKTARGYRFSSGGWASVVWVDVKTDLPVRIENQVNFNADGTKTIVLTNLVFDVPLDDSLFATTEPEGYTSQTIPVTIDRTPPTEKDLIELFADYAKRSGGRFPNDLGMSSLLDVLGAVKMEKTGLFDAATTAWLAKVGRGIGLVWSMPPDSDARYTGKGVKLGEADKPIFRYRPTDSKTYRVIHGDLSVKEVDPGQIGK